LLRVVAFLSALNAVNDSIIGAVSLLNLPLTTSYRYL
jgi:hypothetical protein